jgi:hypothetical protein
MAGAAAPYLRSLTILAGVVPLFETGQSEPGIARGLLGGRRLGLFALVCAFLRRGGPQQLGEVLPERAVAASPVDDPRAPSRLPDRIALVMRHPPLI